MPGYTYPGTHTVKNRLGALTHEELERRESRLVTFRQYEMECGHGPSGQFDTAHLKAIHRHLFQDVYEWAGHTRDERVKLSDGTIATEPVLRKRDGKPFMAGSRIAGALEHVAATLRDADYLRGLVREDFAIRAADIMAEINAVHAFREGNGRTQRAFVYELAKQAGHELDFTVVSRERMIRASIAANEGKDNGMMRRMFIEIGDPERIAALAHAIVSLDRQRFPWNDHYIATTEPGHRVEVTMAGIAGTHFMARTTSEILIGATSDLPSPHPEPGERFSLDPDVQQTEVP